MTKSMFSVFLDGTGKSFVYQVGDEQDKNHDPMDTSHDTIGEGRLYAVPGHPFCPVETYISKLHPDLSM